MYAEEFKQKMAERDYLERHKNELRQLLTSEINEMSDPFNVKDKGILLNNALEHLTRYSEVCRDSNNIYKELIDSFGNK